MRLRIINARNVTLCIFVFAVSVLTYWSLATFIRRVFLSDKNGPHYHERIMKIGHGIPNIVTTEDVTTHDTTDERRMLIKKMMKHAWNNYVRYAWGKDHLRPVSKSGSNSGMFGSSNDPGATIVDSMDTMYIMGMKEEFEQARSWIANLSVDQMEGTASVFETNIRFVGGFLSCFALTGDTMFRDKAQQVADRLLPAFQTPTGIPYSLVNIQNGESRNWASGGCSVLSEVGSLHLEFTYLSDITGNPEYKDKVTKVRNYLQTLKNTNGLYPNFMNPKTGQRGMDHTSLGAFGDSFYEYLLKAWIQSGKQDKDARSMYDQAMESVSKHLLRKSKNGLLYLMEMMSNILGSKMEHLACFAGGLYALGASTLKSTVSYEYMRIGKALTDTCHESYVRTATGLGPESFEFTNDVGNAPFASKQKQYMLRPEVVESYFVLWRLTKDQKYRDWGWEAVQAIEKHCRVEGGYTGLTNVYKKDSPKDDVQQTFFLAETLKYLYLLFSDDNLISLNEWVFNTEAHPLPIKGTVSPINSRRNREEPV